MGGRFVVDSDNQSVKLVLLENVFGNLEALFFSQGNPVRFDDALTVQKYFKLPGKVGDGEDGGTPPKITFSPFGGDKTIRDLKKTA